jgi:hypothetical protein
MTNKHVPKWYARRGWALVTALVLLLAAYLVGSRALNTGSWQQYGLTFVCLVFGLNRLFRGIWPQKVN